MNGVTFNWKEDQSNKNNIGFIAQNVEKVLPELVKIDNDGIRSVSYMHMVAVLTEGIKEQQKIISNQQILIDSLKKDIEQIKNKIN